MDLSLLENEGVVWFGSCLSQKLILSYWIDWRDSCGLFVLFGASRGPRPSADGPGHPRIIHLMQNRLPCIAKAAS